MIKLSVLIVTYNHERYIAQALDSVLMQETSFDYDIIIGEDCSTDNTRNIVLEYHKRYPGKIRLVLHPQNVGARMNFLATYNARQGQYVALLEGDDYWSSPYKLQKQVDYLDAHPDCAACFHDAIVVYDDGSKDSHSFPPPEIMKGKRIFTLADIVSRFFIPTCSIVYRNGLFAEFPEWFITSPMGDWPLHVLHAEHGYFYYLNEALAVYRVHAQGMWSTTHRKDICLGTIDALTVVNQHLHFRFNRQIRANMSSIHAELSNIRGQQGDLRGAFHHALKSFTMSPFTNARQKKDILIYLFRFTLPGTYSFLRKLLRR